MGLSAHFGCTLKLVAQTLSFERCNDRLMRSKFLFEILEKALES